MFWDQALWPPSTRRRLKSLPALVRRELRCPAPMRAWTACAWPREYAFSHQMLHQVTYDTVLKRTRASCHAKVAQWLAALAEHGSQRASDFLGIAAEHFEQAGDAAKAAEYHARAAEHARERYAHDAALIRGAGAGPAGGRNRHAAPAQASCAGGCCMRASKRFFCRGGATSRRPTWTRWTDWPTAGRR